MNATELLTDILSLLYDVQIVLDDYSDVDDGDDGQPVANKAMALLQHVNASVIRLEKEVAA